MNPDWLTFLQANGALLNQEREISFSSPGQSHRNALYPISNLATFTVSGEDAASFLQGQLTCNIKEIDQHRASLGAYCNAKGRVVSTLLICQKEDGFVVIVPQSLLHTVANKLRMYILRAKVQLRDSSDNLCLLGISSSETTFDNLELPQEIYTVNRSGQIVVRLPCSMPRYLVISDLVNATRLWSHTVGANLARAGNSSEWEYMDLSAGIPWFEKSATEQFIPQMLNIDKLGGISFDKGCYIGQEIVARTHYLGKAKRELVLAECCKTAIIDDETTIIDRTTQEIAAKIVAMRCNDRTCRLLLVMQPENRESKTLTLNNLERDKITIIPFQ